MNQGNASDHEFLPIMDDGQNDEKKQNSFLGMETLHDKTARGLRWSFIDVLSSYGITFVVSILLARILSPNEYGLIGIALIFVAIANCFVDSGLGNAIIRKKKADEEDYGTVFVANLVMSIAVTGIIYVCAPWIAVFFKRDELTSIIRVLSLVIIINAFAITQRTRLTKNIDFKTQTLIALASTLTSGTIGIVMALNGFGVWALVAQQMSRQILDALLLWIHTAVISRSSHQRIHYLCFSFTRFKDLFGFGWKILVSGLIQTLWRQAYPTMIGRCYGSATLGQYTRANQFCSLFSENLTSLIQRVSFPSLSSIQDEKERMIEAYRKVIKCTMMATFVCMFGMAATARPLIITLIGEEWSEAIPILQLLCVSMIFYPLISINGNMLQIYGRSDWFLKTEIIQKSMSVGTIVVGIVFNIYWMLVGSIVTNFASYLVTCYYSKKITGYGVRQQLKDIRPDGIIAIVMSLAVYVIGFLPLNETGIFIIQIIVGGGLTILLHEKKQLPEYKELKNEISRIIKK